MEFSTLGLRHRVTTSINDVRVFEGSGYWYNTWHYFPTSIELMYVGKEMWDLVVPDFKKRINAGEIINNPMRKVVTSRRSTPGKGVYHCYSPNSNGTPSYEEYYWPTPYAGLNKTSDYDLEIQQALTDAFSRVSLSELQALASLGELPETLKWIASILGRFKSLFFIFRRKVWKKMFDPTSAWLEFRYAVRPLVFEMQQAQNALQKIKEGFSNPRNTARGVIEFDTTSSSVISQYIKYGTATYDVTSKLRVTIRAGVLYTVDVMSDALSALGFDEPLESVYELIPFSFILDWFIGVGQVLSSLSLPIGTKVLTNFVTVEVHQSATSIPKSYLIIAGDNHNGTSSYSVNLGTSITEYIHKTRYVDVQRTVAGLLPQFGFNLDFGKAIDLTAIGKQMFRR